MDRWIDRLSRQMSAGKGLSLKEVKANLNEIADDYAAPVSYTHLTIVGPKVLAKATDELAKGIMAVITGGDGVIDFGYIGVVLLTLLGLYLLSALFSYVQGFTMAGISAKVSYNLRQQIIQKINRLPLGYFHKVSQGAVSYTHLDVYKRQSSGRNRGGKHFGRDRGSAFLFSHRRCADGVFV